VGAVAEKRNEAVEMDARSLNAHPPMALSFALNVRRPGKLRSFTQFSHEDGQDGRRSAIRNRNPGREALGDPKDGADEGPHRRKIVGARFRVAGIGLSYFPQLH
jgi:hypothetical protein